jgi:hypothetical protein
LAPSHIRGLKLLLDILLKTHKIKTNVRSFLFYESASHHVFEMNPAKWSLFSPENIPV